MRILIQGLVLQKEKVLLVLKHFPCLLSRVISAPLVRAVFLLVLVETGGHLLEERLALATDVNLKVLEDLQDYPLTEQLILG